MSAPAVGNAVRTAMKEQTDFIVVNFANGDMVGHTGVFDGYKLKLLIMNLGLF